MKRISSFWITPLFLSSISMALTGMLLYAAMQAFTTGSWTVLPVAMGLIATLWYVTLTGSLLSVVADQYEKSLWSLLRQWGGLLLCGQWLVYGVTVMLFAPLFAGFTYACTVLVYGIFLPQVPLEPGYEFLLELTAVQLIAVSVVLLSAYLPRGMILLMRIIQPDKGYWAIGRQARHILHTPAWIKSPHAGLITFAPLLATIPIWLGLGMPRMVFLSLIIASIIYIGVATIMPLLLIRRYTQHVGNDTSGINRY